MELLTDGTFWSALATIVTLVALIYSIQTFSKTMQASHYTELDAMYMEILKMALDKPYLITSTTIREAQQEQEYDIYAFMVWNFVEAIYDRCESDKDLCETWYPIIDAENRKHGQWFAHPDNRHKFKETFHRFIGEGSYAACAA